MVYMTVDDLCDKFTLEELQMALRDVDKVAVRFDLQWYTVSERADRMRAIRGNLITASDIKKTINIAVTQAEETPDVGPL